MMSTKMETEERLSVQKETMTIPKRSMNLINLRIRIFGKIVHVELEIVSDGNRFTDDVAPASNPGKGLEEMVLQNNPLETRYLASDFEKQTDFDDPSDRFFRKSLIQQSDMKEPQEQYTENGKTS